MSYCVRLAIIPSFTCVQVRNVKYLNLIPHSVKWEITCAFLFGAFGHVLYVFFDWQDTVMLNRLFGNTWGEYLEQLCGKKVKGQLYV